MMGEDVYTEGDIVSVLTYNGGSRLHYKYIGRVISIILTQTNEEVPTYTVITGNGDRNTQCTIKIQMCYGLVRNCWWWTSRAEMIPIPDGVIYNENPHDVNKITSDDITVFADQCVKRINEMSMLVNNNVIVKESENGFIKPKIFKRKK